MSESAGDSDKRGGCIKLIPINIRTGREPMIKNGRIKLPVMSPKYPHSIGAAEANVATTFISEYRGR